MGREEQMKVVSGRLRAYVRPETYNTEDNTVDVVFATETPIRRYDWWNDRLFNEVLEISEDAIDFVRLQNGASVLDTHISRSLQSVIGVVTGGRVEGKLAVANIRLSEEESDKETVNKIRKGIIRNISVGYDVLEYSAEETQNPDEIPTLRATRWQPLEISFVPVPADYNSQTRSEEDRKFNFVKIVNPKIMEVKQDRKQPAQEVQPKAEQTPAPESERVNVEEVRSQAVADERQRVANITDACQRAGLPADFTEKLISSGANIDAARASVIDEIAKRANPAPVQVEITGEDESVQTRNNIVSGIMERANPGSVKDFAKNDKAKPFRNMRMLDLAKDRLRAKGISHSLLNEREIVKRALATTDFPDLLASTFERSLRRFYDTTTDDWRFIARQESVTDFRQKTGIKVDGNVSFEEIPEGGEYKESPILQNEKAGIRLKKYGKKYSITDIAIINDDLSVFSRLPRIMAIGAQQFQSEAVWANVIANKNAWDGKALFHTDHKNLEATAGNKTAPNETSLSAARTSMRRQKSLAGNILNIVPRFLIVPAELETTARKLVTAIMATTTGDVNVFANAFDIVVVNQLTDKDAWYLAADPEAITADGIVYAYLNGETGLRTESRVNFNTDALEVKGSLAFATAIWGWQGWFKNPGK